MDHGERPEMNEARRRAAAMDDDALVGELRRLAAELDAPPGNVSTAAREAILTRDLDGELAELIGDSRVVGAGDPLAFEPIRADAEARGSWMLSFAGGGVQVDLEVSDDRGQLRLVGQLSDAAASGCYLVFADGERRRLDLDELGRFVVPDARHGAVRLQCQSAGGGRVTTAWVTI
jgi:hypothetical protein